VQSFAPLNGICAHVWGVHFYSGDMSRQAQADHYCSHISEDVQQCILYDSDKPNARIIGVEYVISEKLYKNLPEAEKKLWHSHIYEIKGGLAVAEEVPGFAEKEFMNKLIKSYGKAFQFWHVDRGDELPLGTPELLMSFTANGQVSAEMLKKREECCGPTISEKMLEREDIEIPEKDPMADYWMSSGSSVSVTPVEIEMKILHKV